MLVDDERRDFKRLETATDATITRLTTGEVMTAALVNLSASGCAFFLDVAIELDEEVEILIRSPSERLEPLRRAGRVARIARDEGGRLIGVQFLMQRE
jgi:c-di-GMP-binding flagellar brake protein YcgR